MSKLLSEEVIEIIFNKNYSRYIYPDRKKNKFGIYEERGIRNAFDGFKSAFSLLMPIIEKQADKLDYYSKEENWSYPMGYGMNKTNICVMDTDELHYGGKRARQALQETKQMLEQLGEMK